MLPSSLGLRARALVALVAVLPALALAGAATAAPSGGQTGSQSGSQSGSTNVDRQHAQVSAKTKDPRTTRGLFVDPKMPAANEGPDYAMIGSRAQALWISNEYYPKAKVRGIVATYTGRANKAGKTPTLSIYAIPDRDCGGASSGGLPGATAYKSWIQQVAKGVKGQHAILVLEPDALPFYGQQACANAGNRLSLLRFASRVLSNAGAWVYIDAGHSDWTPYDNRALLLKKAGIGYARGFSTNVSNFRPTADEKAYAGYLLRELRKLGVTGKKYVVDTSRNGAADPVSGEVLNPTWARLGKRPKLVFDGAFDGTLWVKHPGESDGEVNGGPPSGQWCDFLADRLLVRPESGSCN